LSTSGVTLTYAPASISASGITASSFVANWSASQGATGYYLYVATDLDFANIVPGYNKKDVLNTLSYTVTGLPAGIPYYFKVASYNIIFDASPFSATANTSSGVAPSLAAQPGTNITSVSFTANWLALPGANGYDLDVSTDPGFATFITGLNNKDVGNVLSYTVSGLTPNTPYYFRVRAYFTGGSGTNSLTGAVTTSPLAPPTLANPQVTNITPISFRANWLAVAGATGYFIDIAKDGGFITFVTGLNNKDVGNVISYTVTGLAPNTAYYFRVRAYNSAGAGGNSSVSSTATLVNVAAILINIESAPVKYSVKQSSVQVSNTITVQDNIHTSLASATISIAGNYTSGQDLLLFTNQNGITGTWDAISGSMVLTGNVAPAVYQAALRTVQYKNSSASPVTSDRIISFTVNDGYDNSNLQSRIINYTTTGVEDLASMPKKYELYQSYPNPFNPTTMIKFDLPNESKVSLKVYNLLGEEVATVVNGIMPAGHQSVAFNASKLASGMYIYRIEAGSFSQVKKMLLMK
jgi:hypothetical protein